MKKGKMSGQHVSLVSRPCGLAVRFRKNRSGSDQFCRVDGTRAATRVDGKDFRKKRACRLPHAAAETGLMESQSYTFHERIPLLLSLVKTRSLPEV